MKIYKELMIVTNKQDYIFDNELEAFEFFNELRKNKDAKEIVEDFYLKIYKNLDCENNDGSCEDCCIMSSEDLEELYTEVIYTNTDKNKSIRKPIVEVDDSKYYLLQNYPNFDINGSLQGMLDKYYGWDANLVQCGNYIYNVPESLYKELL